MSEEARRQRKDMSELLAAKRAAQREFSHIPGVEGFGIGRDKLRIYVSNERLCHELPKKFHGVQVDFILAEDVVAVE